MSPLKRLGTVAQATRWIAYDCETTGVDVFGDRIVSAAVVSVDEGQRPDIRTWLVNPGVDIPAEATAIHHITTEHARAHGVAPAQALFEITGHLALAIANRNPLVIFNAPFDLTMLEAENRRHHQPSLMDRLDTHTVLGCVVDPLVIDKHLDPYRKGSRTLVAQCEHHKVTLTGAHDCAADALACLRLAMLHTRTTELGSWTLERLYAAQADWHADQARSLAAYFSKRGNQDRADSVSTDWPLRAEPVPAQGALA